MVYDNLPNRLTAIACAYQDRVALTFIRKGSQETEMSFGQLHKEIQLLTRIILTHGVTPSSRVVLFLEKSISAVLAHFAILRSGAVSVPLNPGFTKSEMNYLLKDASPALIITDPRRKSFIEDVYPEATIYEIPDTVKYQPSASLSSEIHYDERIDVAGDAPALIIYTSGTTGNPKGAVLTHRNLLSDTDNISEVWQLNSQDVVCHSLPLFHVHGLCFGMQTPLLQGAQINLLDSFDPEHVLTQLSSRTEPRSTVFMAVPAMYTKLLEHIGNAPGDYQHLRLITSGSAPLPERDFKRIAEAFGQEPVEREGMSETGMNFTNPLDGNRIPGSIGIPLPGLKVRVVDPRTFHEVSPGEIGELWLKSESIAAGYWRKPNETKATYHEGWFRTGDLGRVDRNGYYYLTDRIKHIIISGGENISAKEVESVIDSMEGVDESVVVGKPDDKWGEIVVAAVRLKPSCTVTEEEIKSYCKQHLHPWKCPKKVLFITDIPRNTMGKVLKEMVKKLFHSIEN